MARKASGVAGKEVSGTNTEVVEVNGNKLLINYNWGNY